VRGEWGGGKKGGKKGEESRGGRERRE